MSEIIEARRRIVKLLKFGEMDRAAKTELEAILALMTRDPAVRRAPAQNKPVTPMLKAQVLRLASEHPDMTIHDIADAVGLRNSGRVSEILNGKR